MKKAWSTIIINSMTPRRKSSATHRRLVAVVMSLMSVMLVMASLFLIRGSLPGLVIDGHAHYLAAVPR